MERIYKSNKLLLLNKYGFILSTLVFPTMIQADGVEEVVVTGSRIQRADLEATTPVVSFGSEEIANSGAPTLSDFLSNSANVNAGLPYSENMTLSQMPGVRSIDYRGVGGDYVLILLNGRRISKNPITQSVDINLLPTAAIERVEILSSGRSAVYGADAVSGVINVITKKDFDGFEVDSFVGQSSRGDGEQYSFSIVNGFNQADVTGLFSFDYFRQEPVSSADRDISKSTQKRGRDKRSGTGPYANIKHIRKVDSKTKLIRALTDSTCPENDRYSGSNGEYCLYDYADQYQAIPKSERFGLFTDVNKKLSGEHTANVQFRYNYNKTTTKNAPPPFSVKYDVNESNLKAIKKIFSSEASLQNFSNGLRKNDEIHIRRRLNEVGKREVETEGQTYEGIFSLAGNFDGDNLQYIAELGYGRSRYTNIGVNGQLYQHEIEEALLTEIAEKRFDLFDHQHNSENEILSNLERMTLRANEFTTTFLNLRLNGNEDYFSWAVGFESLIEDYKDEADKDYKNIIGGAAANGGGERFGNGVYFEILLLPNDLWEISAASRYDAYDKFASQMTYQLGVSYRPSEIIMWRASSGTGYKVPSLADLYVGESGGVRYLVDPKWSTQTEQIPSMGKGNPDLEAEKAEFWGAGFLLKPIEVMDLSVDYWNLKVKDKIVGLSPQTILNNEDKYSHLVHRGPDGKLAGYQYTQGVYVESKTYNASELQASGMDYDLRISQESSLGTFQYNLKANHLISRKQPAEVGGDLCEGVNTYSLPRWQGSLSVDWFGNYWNAGGKLRVVGDYEDDSSGRYPGSCVWKPEREKVHPFVTLDVQTGYSFNSGTSLTFGINNVADAEPPFTDEDGYPFYNKNLYSAMGRFYYMKVGHSF